MKRALSVILALISAGTAVFILWRPVITDPKPHTTVNYEMKNWYLPDQLAYAGIANNVQNGHPAYREPFLGSGDSIYPSGYYWTMGLLARFTRLTTFGAWNVLGIMTTLAMSFGFGLVGFAISRNKWAWGLSASVIFIGTLQWFTNHDFVHLYQVHAVLWPALGDLFSGNAQSAGMALTAISLGMFLESFRHYGKINSLLFIGSGALVGLTANIHTYAFLFAVLLMALVFVAHALSDMSKKHAYYCLLLIAVGFVVADLLPTSSELNRFGALYIFILLPIVLFRSLRIRYLKKLILYFGVAGFFSLPIMIRIIQMSRNPNSFYYLRQKWATEIHVVLPAKDVLINLAPQLLSIGLIAFLLWRTRSDRYKAILFVAIGTGLASFIMIFNQYWKFQQEPYRFFPFGQLFLGAVAFPIIIEKIRTRTQLILQILVSLVILSTLLTTSLFINRTKNIRLAVSANENQLYKRLGKITGTKSAVFFDRCIAQLIIKSLIDIRVVDINRGAAIGPNYLTVENIKTLRDQSRFPTNSQISLIGIKYIITTNFCASNGPEMLGQRFGPPIATVPFPDPKYCGLPEGSEYFVYSMEHPNPDPIPNEPSTTAVFKELNGQQVVPNDKCAIGLIP